LLAIYKFLATRQLCAFSGSDKYINLNQNQEVHNLYDSIQNGTITHVNSEVAISEPTSDIVRFKIKDRILNKSFDMHIKKQNDGMRFTLTNYVNYIKMIPGQVLFLDIQLEPTSCDIFIEYKELYKYVLEKHTTENLYHIWSDNPPTGYTTITDNTDIFLSNFGIIATNDNSHVWSRKNSFSYETNNYSLKYIGVPFSTELDCDEFNRIEDIL
jgi:hypothetical protein